MILTPTAIAAYIECPLKGFCVSRLAETNMNPRSLYLSKIGLVISNVIIKIFVTQLRTKKPISWKYVIRVMQEETLRETKDNNKDLHIMDKLYSWYYNFYIKNIARTLPMVPVELPLQHGLVFKDDIDLLCIQDKIELIDFREINIKGTSNINPYILNQDWFVATRIWGTSKATGLKPTHYTRIIIHGQKMDMQTIKLEPKALNKNTEHVISNVLQSIGSHVLYPVIGNQCETCQFNNVCKKEEWNIC